MHEAAIVEGLMRILDRQVKLHGIAVVKRVNLRVGRLRAVEPEQLRACFDMFAEGTPAEGAALEIEVVPIRARCRHCGSEFDVAGYRFECATCGGGDVDVVQGQELYVESIEASGNGAVTK